jgi:Carboxypeptidase regulatory-like domain/TonB-dependent Receptor Plug Domain
LHKQSVAIHRLVTTTNKPTFRRPKDLLRSLGAAVIALLMAMICSYAFAQVDQGTISGVVQDTSGAAIPGAQVILSDVDTGLVLTTKTSGSGVYVFSPVKIGHYTVRASAPNFESTVQQNLTLNVSQTLNVPIVLKAGSVSVTITVSTAPPLLESQQASVSQTFSTQTINNTPLAQRNWVYMAQLSTGVVPSTGTRGGGTGDYEANGQRAEQNNYLLDGVDNNVDIVDYMNGSMYAVSPPPDALAEFNLDTTAYSAQYGHSAGSVLNVALKSGTNQIHGDLWEYNRNTIFNAINWNANPLLPNPPYHYNQFGATLGFPILHNKLFYFGDMQVTRIALGSIEGPISVPTPRMRNGDFSELLDTANLNGASCPTVLYAPNSDDGSYSCANHNPTTLTGTLQQSGTQVTTSSTGYTYPAGQNVFNPANLDPVALKLLQMYPLPNYRGWTSANNTSLTAYGNVTNNLVETLPTSNDIVQWDQRVDWDIASHDRAYARYSYNYQYDTLTPPLGPILDGTSSYAGSRQHYMSQSFMFSESHTFTPTLVNELRFAYNWGNYQNLQPNDTVNESASLGLGGVPYSGPGYVLNGGIPSISVSGIQAFGSHGNDPSIEKQNIYEILDNVTKVLGSHTFKAGVSFQNFRIYFLQPPTPRGSYTYSGTYTGVTSSSGPTGYGVADFLFDQMNGNSLTNEPVDNLENWYNAGYGEDTWRMTPKFTFTYGLRYDYFQPTGEMAGGFANFVPLTWGVGTGTADYVLPAKWQGTSIMASTFTNLLAANNVAVVYDSNPRLSTGQKLNFAPRLGLAYQLDSNTVVRAGGGIFYGDIFGLGSNPNIGGNYPFMIHSGLSSTTCVNGDATNQSRITTYCPSLSPTVAVSENNPASAVAAGQPGAAQNYPTSGQFQNPDDTLELGMTNQISGPSGISGFINSTVINGRDPHIQTPYIINYDMSFQRSLGNNISATLMYVGNLGRHLDTLITTNQANELQANGKNSTVVAGFPSLGTGNPWERFGAESWYNSLQAKLERRFSNGMSYLASYTWSHNEDNSIDPLGGGDAYRMWNIIPIKDEVTNSNYDVRQRFTFNGSYQLPFGKGRPFMSSAPLWLDEIAGGWTSDLTFVGQTGIPFTVSTNGINTPSGEQATHAILVGDPYAGGGSPNATNPQLTSCPAHVHNKTNYYNPCAFDNPLNGAATPNLNNGLGSFPSTPVTDEATAKLYLGAKANQIYGPGYERINTSITKNFTTWREQYLQFRADAFNLFNHPSLANPSSAGLNSSAGQITAPQSLQTNVPDARFFQLSAKYVF